MNQIGTPNQYGEPKESKFIGTGEGESPLANVPFKKIDMRTMESDMSSVKSSGGGAPAPYAPGASGQPQTSPQSSSNAPQVPQGMATFNVADMSAPTSGGMPPVGGSPAVQRAEPSTPHGNNKAFLWAIIGIVILGLLAAGYFFLLPGLRGVGELKEEASPAAEAPAVEETESPAPSIGTEPETVAVHASFFKTPADVVAELQPQLWSSTGVKALIQPASTSVPLLKELVLKTSGNQPIAFGSFTEMFFPSFFSKSMLLNFQSDFTFVSYANKTGTWLGFVARLKDSADIAAVQREMNAFQSEAGIKDFYLSDPGSALSWKDGKIGGKPASVMEFSTRGIEFSYVWFDRYLIVSSNMEGAAEIVKRLGF